MLVMLWAVHANAQNAPPKPFETNGYTIASEEWNASTPEVSSTPVTLHRSIPHIVSPLDARARAFYRAVSTFGFNLWKSAGGPLRRDDHDDNSVDYDLGFAPNLDEPPGLISITYVLWNYVHGTGHGNAYEYSFVWNLAAGRTLKPEDIFNSKTNWDGALSAIITTDLEGTSRSRVCAIDPNNFSDIIALPAHTLSDVKSVISNPENWIVENKGLEILYGSYWTQDTQCAVADWASLKPYLKKGGLIQP